MKTVGKCMLHDATAVIGAPPPAGKQAAECRLARRSARRAGLPFGVAVGENHGAPASWRQ
jgi:hypothetical protein